MRITKTKIYGVPMYECYIDFYDHYFYFFFGKKNLKKMQDAIYGEQQDERFESGRACVFRVVEQEHSNCIYMWFPNKDWYNVAEGRLAHECLHLIDFISERIGLKHDVKNQEVYAQFMGYLFRHLLPLFKKK